MLACEVRCNAGCCGIDAFEIHPKWIRAWLEDNDSVLEDGGSSTYWAQMLKEWRTAIENAPFTPLPIPPQPESSAQRSRRQVYETLTLLGCGLMGAAPIIAIIALIYWLLGRL
jgi:hypothetical protein